MTPISTLFFLMPLSSEVCHSSIRTHLQIFVKRSDTLMGLQASQKVIVQNEYYRRKGTDTLMGLQASQKVIVQNEYYRRKGTDTLMGLQASQKVIVQNEYYRRALTHFKYSLDFMTPISTLFLLDAPRLRSVSPSIHYPSTNFWMGVKV